MLDASLVNAVMRASVGHHVQMALLLNLEGEIVSADTVSDPAVKDQFGLVASAVFNAWRIYSHCSLCIDVNTQQIENDSMEEILINFKFQKICAMSVAGNWIVALSCTEDMEAGLLKLKTAELQKSLDKLMRPVLS